MEEIEKGLNPKRWLISYYEDHEKNDILNRGYFFASKIQFCTIDEILSWNGVDTGAIFVIIYRHSEAERRYLKYVILTHYTLDRTQIVRRILNPLV